MKKIESLTPKQEEQMIAFREEWRKIGLSTDPVDKEQTKIAISEMYRLIGKQPPVFIFCPSLLFVQFQIEYCKEVLPILNLKAIGDPANGYSKRFIRTR